jgi:hypothetical protein
MQLRYELGTTFALSLASRDGVSEGAPQFQNPLRIGGHSIHSCQVFRRVLSVRDKSLHEFVCSEKGVGRTRQGIVNAVSQLDTSAVFRGGYMVVIRHIRSGRVSI